ncbi:MAG: aromatic ring-hydroxylating dioxygenase subunit alpha [Pseudomonadota bacterium]
MNLQPPARAFIPDVVREIDYSGPLSTLTGLPNEAYTSADFAAFERDAILARTWTCVGFGAQLREGRGETGYVKPVELLGLPLLLVRERDDTLRVFHNTCSHRGLRLVDEAKRTTGLITCPYHGWCYATSGKLRKTPHIGGEGIHEDARFDPTPHGLREVRSHVFMDMIFVNISGDAEPFEDYIRPVTDHWHEFDFTAYRHGGDNSSWFIDVRGNWKLAQENHVDGYHLPFIHPKLQSYSPLAKHYPLLIDGRASGVGSHGQDHNGLMGDDVMPMTPGLSEPWQKGRAEFLSIFPNIMMGVHNDHIWCGMLLPQAHDHTLEYMELYYHGESATDPAYADARRMCRDRIYEVFLEDKEVVERMQTGRHSPAFQGGALSPALDEPSHALNAWMAGEIARVVDSA